MLDRHFQLSSALAVFLNGQELAIRTGESKQEHMLEADGDRSLALVWTSHYSALGTTVEITTGAAANLPPCHLHTAFHDS